MGSTATDTVARLERLLARRAARTEALAVPRHDRRLHAAVAEIAHDESRARHGAADVAGAVFPDWRALPLLP